MEHIHRQVADCGMRSKRDSVALLHDYRITHQAS
jgi:hypothetical protein